MPLRILIKICFFLGTCGIFRRIKRHAKPGGQHAVAIMLRHGVPAFRIFVPRIRALRVLQRLFAQQSSKQALAAL